MEQTSEPPLTPAILEEIRALQFLVHKKFFEELAPLRNFPSVIDFAGFAKFAAMSGHDPPAPKPLMPKQPIRLLEIIGRYADELFKSELVFFPSVCKDAWYTSLASRVDRMVIDNVRRIDGLEFHATIEQMRTKISGELLKYLHPGKGVVTVSAAKPTRKEQEAVFYEASRQDPFLRAQEDSKYEAFKALIVGPNSGNGTRALPKREETIASQIGALRLEARLTHEAVADGIRVDPSTVYRHISGETKPQLKQIGKYESLFSKLLKRNVVINIMHTKRK